MGAIEPWHLIVVLLVVLVVLGPNRLPEVGRSLGETIREFRKSTEEPRAPSADVVTNTPSVAASPPPQDSTPGTSGTTSGPQA